MDGPGGGLGGVTAAGAGAGATGAGSVAAGVAGMATGVGAPARSRSSVRVSSSSTRARASSAPAARISCVFSPASASSPRTWLWIRASSRELFSSRCFISSNWVLSVVVSASARRPTSSLAQAPSPSARDAVAASQKPRRTPESIVEAITLRDGSTRQKEKSNFQGLYTSGTRALACAHGRVRPIVLALRRADRAGLRLCDTAWWLLPDACHLEPGPDGRREHPACVCARHAGRRRGRPSPHRAGTGGGAGTALPLDRQYPGRAPLRRGHDPRRRGVGQHVVPRGAGRHRRLGGSPP